MTCGLLSPLLTVCASRALTHKVRHERPERDLERLRRQSKLTVRERLDLLLDPGTWVEYGLLADHMDQGLGDRYLDPMLLFAPPFVSFMQARNDVPALLGLADNLIELKAICACGRKATMVVRVNPEGRVESAGAQVEIGGNDLLRIGIGGGSGETHFARRPNA